MLSAFTTNNNNNSLILFLYGPVRFQSERAQWASGDRNESCSPLGCTELRCHGHSADNWAHSSSCRLNTIKSNNEHLAKLHTVSELILSHIDGFSCHRGQLNKCHVRFFVLFCFFLTPFPRYFFPPLPPTWNWFNRFIKAVGENHPSFF